MWAAAVRIVLIAALVVCGCGEPAEPRPVEVLVPAGNFRAQTLCARWFQRACKLSFQPPHGRGRHRVLVWLDAFWADTELVTRSGYQACRAAGVCRSPPDPPDPAHPVDECGYYRLAYVPFADARAYCRWHDRRLPTPDEYERMGRWTDGRRFAAGVPQVRSCERRPSPEGIRSLNLTDQWVEAQERPILMGGGGSTNYQDVGSGSFTSAFRCVRSANPAASTTDPGRAIVVPDQSEPWLLGGPDG